MLLYVLLVIMRLKKLTVELVVSTVSSADQACSTWLLLSAKLLCNLV